MATPATVDVVVAVVFAYDFITCKLAVDVAFALIFELVFKLAVDCAFTLFPICLAILPSLTPALRDTIAPLLLKDP